MRLVSLLAILMLLAACQLSPEQKEAISDGVAASVVERLPDSMSDAAKRDLANAIGKGVADGLDAHTPIDWNQALAVVAGILGLGGFAINRAKTHAIREAEQRIELVRGPITARHGFAPPPPPQANS